MHDFLKSFQSISNQYLGLGNQKIIRNCQLVWFRIETRKQTSHFTTDAISSHLLCTGKNWIQHHQWQKYQHLSFAHLSCCASNLFLSVLILWLFSSNSIRRAIISTIQYEQLNTILHSSFRNLPSRLPSNVYVGVSNQTFYCNIKISESSDLIITIGNQQSPGNASQRSAYIYPASHIYSTNNW